MCDVQTRFTSGIPAMIVLSVLTTSAGLYRTDAGCALLPTGVNERTSWGIHPMALMKILSLNSNHIMTAKSISQVGEPTGTRFKSQLNPRYHILVVDDDGDIRHLNSEVLACSGYKVDVAADGALGWDALQLNSYDLLLTDHDMPNLTGV